MAPLREHQEQAELTARVEELEQKAADIDVALAKGLRNLDKLEGNEKKAYVKSQLAGSDDLQQRKKDRDENLEQAICTRLRLLTMHLGNANIPEVRDDLAAIGRYRELASQVQLIHGIPPNSEPVQLEDRPKSSLDSLSESIEKLAPIDQQLKAQTGVWKLRCKRSASCSSLRRRLDADSTTSDQIAEAISACITKALPLSNRQSDLPPENWSSENESPRWEVVPRRTACAGAGLRRSRSSVC